MQTFKKAIVRSVKLKILKLSIGFHHPSIIIPTNDFSFILSQLFSEQY